MDERQQPRWLLVAAALLLLTAVVPRLDAGSRFLTVVYPQLGSPGKGLDNGTVRHAWSDPTPVQFHEDTFTATLYYGRKGGQHGGTPVKIAAVNTATLTGAKDDFTIVQVGAAARILDREGSAARGGGYKVSWQWKVVPLKSGQLQLTLAIEPQLGPGTGLSSSQFRVNEPLSIPVTVNPRQADLDAVYDEASHMAIAYASSVVVGHRSHVSADLPLAGRSDTVHAEVDLALDTRSVQATIEPGPTEASGDHLRRSWWVTPTQAGTLGLLFHVNLSTTVGNILLTRSASVERDATSHAPDASIWSRIAGGVNWLNGLAAFAITVLGLVAAWRGLKSKRQKDAARSQAGGT